MMWSCHLCQLDRQNACCWKFQARFQKNFGLLWQKFNVPDASLLDWNKLWQGNLQKQPLFCVFVPFTMYSTCTYVSLWDWQPLHLRLWSYDFEKLIHCMQKKKNHVWVQRGHFCWSHFFFLYQYFLSISLVESFLHKKWQLPYTPIVCVFSIS